MATFDITTLTPTEDLIMELLAARYRLGVTLWTLDSRHRNAITALEEKGLVTSMHGIVGKTLRASLTNAGRDAYLDDLYESPVEKVRRDGQKATAKAWSGFLDLLLVDELADGTKLIDMVLDCNPELRTQLRHALRP